MRIRKIISLNDLRNINILPRPIVLVPMAADLLHHGHIRILKKSSHLGSVVVWLMTDKSLKKYKGNPFLKFEYRKEILKEATEVSAGGNKFNLRTGVNKNPTKLGIKIQFEPSSGAEMDRDTKAALEIALQEKLNDSLSIDFTFQIFASILQESGNSESEWLKLNWASLEPNLK